jgi:hypothetical protein
MQDVAQCYLKVFVAWLISVAQPPSAQCSILSRQLWRFLYVKLCVSSFSGHRMQVGGAHKRRVADRRGQRAQHLAARAAQQHRHRAAGNVLTCADAVCAVRAV